LIDEINIWNGILTTDKIAILADGESLTGEVVATIDIKPGSDGYWGRNGPNL